MTALCLAVLIATGMAASSPPDELIQQQAKVIVQVCRGLPRSLAIAGAERALRYSQEYGVDYALLAAVVSLESSFNPHARGPGGAIGYGQLMPATAQSMRVNAYDPEQNMRAAARYLRGLYDRFGDWDLAIAGYRIGGLAVERAVKRGGLPGVARQYVQKVRTRAALFK